MGKRKLSKKQKGFVKDFIETGNATQAALKNYDVKNERVAASVGHENLTKPDIVNAIEQALPDSLLAEKHLALLNKTIGEEIDTQAVSKGLDMAYRVKGKYAPERHDITSQGDKVNVSPALVAIANEYEKKLKDSQ